MNKILKPALYNPWKLLALLLSIFIFLVVGHSFTNVIRTFNPQNYRTNCISDADCVLQPWGCGSCNEYAESGSAWIGVNINENKNPYPYICPGSDCISGSISSFNKIFISIINMFYSPRCIEQRCVKVRSLIPSFTR